MKVLIAEDDLITRQTTQDIISPYGVCHVAADGKEAVEAFETALRRGEPYDLICMDIEMPRMSGHEALDAIRRIEAERNILFPDTAKVIMISVYRDWKNINGAFKSQCDRYLVKPFERERLLNEVRELGLL